MSFIQNIQDSFKKGGKYGFISASFQVTNLLWLRTVNSYQNKYGTSFSNTCRILYIDGGILRFYRCYIPALGVGGICKISELSFYYFINNYPELSSIEKNGMN